MNNKRRDRNFYGAYNFPSWNYGCTLGNNSQTGAYETYYNGTRESKHHEVPIAAPVPSPPPPSEETHSAPSENEGPHKQVRVEDGDKEDSSPEKPIQDILGGRNAIVFCNEQSKLRNLNMEWEQVSEEGPPHMKVFTWCLKIGDMSAKASANSKKGAKNKAAEDMARKLDKLPRPKKRSHQFQMMGYPPPMMYGMNPMMYPPHMHGSPWQNHPRPTKKKKPNNEGNDNSSVENKPKLPNPSQDNPISQLYEYCKRIKAPEPVFTTISEKPLESRITERGFYRKKVEFTLQVEAVGKKYEGTAMTKKDAKHKAAGTAWSSIQDKMKANNSN